MELREALLDLLGEDHCRDFPAATYRLHTQGWGSTAPVFREYIEKLRPTSIIEVGSWLGGSAIHMAGVLRDLDIDGTICCVDTWLGGTEHMHPDFRDALDYRHGTPRIFEQFLANVINSGFGQVILPLRQTSRNAALYLLSKKVVVDLVYIDASHEEEDVYQDIVQYWELLRPGGAMIGDDCSTIFPGVVNAVLRFCRERGLLPKQDQTVKWILDKPATSP